MDSINGLTKIVPSTTTWIVTNVRAANAVLARPSTAAPAKAFRSNSFLFNLILVSTASTLSGVATLAPLFFSVFCHG